MSQKFKLRIGDRFRAPLFPFSIRGLPLHDHAAESTRDTETLTRYPSAAKSRINRSLDTLSRFPFKMDVTLVREEPPFVPPLSA